MRGLLIVLCALVTTAAVLAGGCAFLVTGIAAGLAPKWENLNQTLFVTLPVLVVAAAVVGINVTLVAAVRRGKAPRRNGWFVMLAVVDLLAACCMFAAYLSDGVLSLQTALLPAALAVKGGLTFLLPATVEPETARQP